MFEQGQNGLTCAKKWSQKTINTVFFPDELTSRLKVAAAVGVSGNESVMVATTRRENKVSLHGHLLYIVKTSSMSSQILMGSRLGYPFFER